MFNAAGKADKAALSRVASSDVAELELATGAADYALPAVRLLSGNQALTTAARRQGSKTWQESRVWKHDSEGWRCTHVNHGALPAETAGQLAEDSHAWVHA